MRPLRVSSGNPSRAREAELSVGEGAGGVLGDHPSRASVTIPGLRVFEPLVSGQPLGNPAFPGLVRGFVRSGQVSGVADQVTRGFRIEGEHELGHRRPARVLDPVEQWGLTETNGSEIVA